MLDDAGGGLGPVKRAVSSDTVAVVMVSFRGGIAAVV
jgi:hypothetical protein